MKIVLNEVNGQNSVLTYDSVCPTFLGYGRCWNAWAS